MARKRPADWNGDSPKSRQQNFNYQMDNKVRKSFFSFEALIAFFLEFKTKQLVSFGRYQ